MSHDDAKEKKFSMADIEQDKTSGPAMRDLTYIDLVKEIALEIAETLVKKDAEYGGSWLRRGGVGAYMMKVRKSDRLEEQARRRGYDVFAAMRDTEASGEKLSDTLLDDAGYAILILAEARARGIT